MSTSGSAPQPTPTPQRRPPVGADVACIFLKFGENLFRRFALPLQMDPIHQTRLEAYFITFSCYGQHLPGDERGWIDRSNNTVGLRCRESAPDLEFFCRRQMKQDPYRMDAARRRIVLASLRKACHVKGWNLLAAHVRETHVHVVLQANYPAERVMNALKSNASRALNRAKIDPPGRLRWARHGSTRRVGDLGQLERALRYVVEEQGEPMSVFVSPLR